MNDATANRKKGNMENTETQKTVAARISLHDYQVLMAQVEAGNFRRMSDAIRACVRYTVTQLEQAPQHD
jgi:Arc/MetJ-type ribon-helix-helix transcriptional regulator